METRLAMSDFKDLGFGAIDRPGDLPALVLAYVGDAVYELAVRSSLVAAGRVKVRQMHQETVRYVNASAQAEALRLLEGILTEDEAAVARRGRNTKSAHAPRRAGVIDYRHSTALECLIGYLFLKGERQRLEEILNIVLSGKV